MSVGVTVPVGRAARGAHLSVGTFGPSSSAICGYLLTYLLTHCARRPRSAPCVSLFMLILHTFAPVAPSVAFCFLYRTLHCKTSATYHHRFHHQLRRCRLHGLWEPYHTYTCEGSEIKWLRTAAFPIKRAAGAGKIFALKAPTKRFSLDFQVDSRSR
jgi:hypothetical protein